MENNRNETNNANEMNQANQSAEGNGTTANQAQTSSTYGYSYINDGQKNPNNIWRAEENTSSAYTNSTYTQTDTNHAYQAQNDANNGYYTQTDANNAYQTQNNANNTYYTQNDANANNAYNNAQSGTENAYSNVYGTPNNQGRWHTHAEAKKQKKEERARKRAAKNMNTTSNFGIKLAKCASIALVFGLVAGTAFEGSSYVAGNLLGTNKEAAIAEKENKPVLNNSTAQNTTPLTATASNSDDGVVSIVEECMPSIVAITNMSLVQYQNFFGQVQNYEVPSAGSGIIVSEDDNYLYIATNNHVVSSATTLTIQFCDESTAAAEIKGTDAGTDLAVVQVKKADIEAATLSAIKVAVLGDSDNIKVGSQAIAIGNALGYGQSVTAGYISAMNREVTMQDETTGESFTNDLIQTDAAINPGNSGGALLNNKGEVIGINSSKYSDTKVEGMGFEITANTAKPIIEDLITREVVSDGKAAYLGIVGENVTDAVSAAYNMPEGVFIKEISKGTAAEKYGLQKGDIITKFDGRDIKTMESLQKRLSYYEAGTEVEITVQRASQGGYQETTVSVVLGKKES